MRLRTTTPLYRIITLLPLILAVACSDGPTGSTRPATWDAVLTAVAGDGQAGQTGFVLPQSLRVRVTNDVGAPAAGVLVDWIVEEPDLVYPAQSVTDAKGEATTYWTPRVAGATRSMIARVRNREVVFHAAIELAPPSNFGELTLLEIETFDGSGQAVHPDVAETSWLATGVTRFLALTPYPFGDATKENPSIYVNVGADHEWRVPPGATNPVALPGAGHLSDTDLIADPLNRELRLYYRQAGDGNTLLVTTSGDGIAWSRPRAMFRTRNHEMVSPTIVRRDAGHWEMWSVNSGGGGCSAFATQVERRTSPDGYSWSDPVTVPMGATNHHVWHIEVQYVEALSRYVAVYSVKTRTDCNTPAMFVATSTDGLTWRSQNLPLVVRGVVPEFRHIVYRSTFVYDATEGFFTFWHSGASFADGKWTWRVATERRLLAFVISEGTSAAMQWAPEPSTAPPLRIPP